MESSEVLILILEEAGDMSFPLFSTFQGAGLRLQIFAHAER
jgi:hypothetical protein